MSSNTSLTIRHDIKSNPQQIFEILCDIRKFGKYHPDYFEISEPAELSNGNFEYTVKEKNRFLGILPRDVTYSIQVSSSETDKIVWHKSRMHNNLSVTIEFSIVPAAVKERVVINETISVQGSPFLVRSMLKRISSAHHTLFLELSVSVKSEFYEINKLK